MDWLIIVLIVVTVWIIWQGERLASAETRRQAKERADKEIVMQDVEQRIIAEIRNQKDPRPSTVIPVVAVEYPTEARVAYWKLIRTGVVSRSLDGRLRLGAS